MSVFISEDVSLVRKRKRCVDLLVFSVKQICNTHCQEYLSGMLANVYSTTLVILEYFRMKPNRSCIYCKVKILNQ